MRTHGVQIFAKPVSQDQLSDDPLVATHISNRILKAAENAKTTAKSKRAEAIEEEKFRASELEQTKTTYCTMKLPALQSV